MLLTKDKILLAFLFAVIGLVSASAAYFTWTGALLPVVARGILFLCLLTVLVILFKLLFILRLASVAQHFGFSLITSFCQQTRLEGTYKKNFWQVHYVSKESGHDPGILRTYIKLQYAKPMAFDDEILDKYKHKDMHGCHVIVVKHIVRPHKNYLLMKVRWLIIAPKELELLMQELVTIAKEAKK